MALYNNSSSSSSTSLKGIPARQTAHYAASGFDQKEYNKLMDFLNNMYAKIQGYDTQISTGIYEVLNNSTTGWHTANATNYVNKTVWPKLDEALKRVFGSFTSQFGRINQASSECVRVMGGKFVYAKWSHTIKHYGMYSKQISPSLNGRVFVNEKIPEMLDANHNKIMKNFDNDMKTSIANIKKYAAYMNDTVIIESIASQLNKIVERYKADIFVIYKSLKSKAREEYTQLKSVTQKSAVSVGGSGSASSGAGRNTASML